MRLPLTQSRVLALMEIVPIFDAHENAHGRMRIHKREKEKCGKEGPKITARKVRDFDHLIAIS